MTQSENPYAASTDPAQPLPPPAPAGSNGLGIAGFVVSLVSICTLFILSPVALLLSLIALFRPPRGFAIAGTIIGGLGSLLLVFFVAATLMAASAAGVAITHVGSFLQTFPALEAATTAINDHHQQHGDLPDEAAGNSLIDDIEDGWGTTLRYEPIDERRYHIISAGPDEQFDTSDDLEFTASVDGGFQLPHMPDVPDMPQPPDAPAPDNQ